MSDSRSVKKATRAAMRKRQRNRMVRSRVKTRIKKVRKAIESGDIPNARQELAAASSIVDRAATRGIFHRNKAARIKSRLTKETNALEQGH